MNYLNYVIAAYLVFAVVMLWDWLAPRLRIRQQLRSAHLLATRKQAAKVNVGGELTR